MAQFGKVVYDRKRVIKQKARVTWISLGYANTRYFSAIKKEKQQRKQNLNLASLDGTKLKEPGDVKPDIVQFYKGSNRYSC